MKKKKDMFLRRISKFANWEREKNTINGGMI